MSPVARKLLARLLLHGGMCHLLQEQLQLGCHHMVAEVRLCDHPLLVNTAPSPTTVQRTNETRTQDLVSTGIYDVRMTTGKVGVD